MNYKNENTNPNEETQTKIDFKKEFLSLFTGIEFYTSEQKGILIRKLKKVKT
jgi:hypothetical protein